MDGGSATWTTSGVSSTMPSCHAATSPPASLHTHTAAQHVSRQLWTSCSTAPLLRSKCGQRHVENRRRRFYTELFCAPCCMLALYVLRLRVRPFAAVAKTTVIFCRSFVPTLIISRRHVDWRKCCQLRLSERATPVDTEQTH